MTEPPRRTRKGALKSVEQSDEKDKIVQLEVAEDVRKALKAISGMEGQPMKIIATNVLRAFIRGYAGGVLAHLVPADNSD